MSYQVFGLDPKTGLLRCYVDRGAVVNTSDHETGYSRASADT